MCGDGSFLCFDVIDIEAEAKRRRADVEVVWSSVGCVVGALRQPWAGLIHGQSLPVVTGTAGKMLYGVWYGQ